MLVTPVTSSACEIGSERVSAESCAPKVADFVGSESGLWEHKVFVENIAVHTWVKKAIIEAGLPDHRIAILNAEVAADPETRQQIAERFNGVGKPGDDEHQPPDFDVVIANSVACEGVDLQRRTCAIHHLDLPWDPATLQQRNGRGVRQGNRFERVKIHYYLGRPSGDGRRLALIDKKRSWMASLVQGQDRVTNNPAATVHVSVEDILLDIVPPEERARVLKEREEEAKRLAEQQAQRARIGANKLLSQVNARFRRAEQSPDPSDASPVYSVYIPVDAAGTESDDLIVVPRELYDRLLQATPRSRDRLPWIVESVRHVIDAEPNPFDDLTRLRLTSRYRIRSFDTVPAWPIPALAESLTMQADQIQVDSSSARILGAPDGSLRVALSLSLIHI